MKTNVLEIPTVIEETQNSEPIEIYQPPSTLTPAFEIFCDEGTQQVKSEPKPPVEKIALKIRQTDDQMGARDSPLAKKAKPMIPPPKPDISFEEEPFHGYGDKNLANPRISAVAPIHETDPFKKVKF